MDGKRLKQIEHQPVFIPQGTVPAFLLKLRNLLDDDDTDHLICWDPDGTSFHLYDQTRFAKEILPQYFKHNNLASFIRQLNMYGFKKLSTIEHGGLNAKDDMEFQNSYFTRENPNAMQHIKRKNPRAERTISSGSSQLREKLSEFSGALQPSQVGDVLMDVKDLKHTQDSMSEQLDIVKRENSALWREIASLRQKHTQQQLIINKLIQFMMTMASNSRNMKRTLPMIEIGPSTKTRRPDPPTYTNTSGPLSSGADSFQQSNVLSESGHSSTSYTNNGITIRDITDDDGFSSPDLTNSTTLEPSELLEPLDEGPIPTTISSLDNTVGAGAMVSVSPSSSLDASSLRSQLTDNVHETQADIDMLKELFNADTLGVPNDTLYDIFLDPNQSASNFPIVSSPQNMYVSDIDLDALMNNDMGNTNKAISENSNQQLSELMTPGSELDGLMGSIVTSPSEDGSLSAAALKDLMGPLQSQSKDGDEDRGHVISSNDLD